MLGKSFGDGIDEANNRAAIKSKSDNLSFVLIIIHLFVGIDRDCVTVCVSLAM